MDSREPSAGEQTSSCCFGIRESAPSAPLPIPLKQAARAMTSETYQSAWLYAKTAPSGSSGMPAARR